MHNNILGGLQITKGNDNPITKDSNFDETVRGSLLPLCEDCEKELPRLSNLKYCDTCDKSHNTETKCKNCNTIIVVGDLPIQDYCYDCSNYCNSCGHSAPHGENGCSHYYGSHHYCPCEKFEVITDN